MCRTRSNAVGSVRICPGQIFLINTQPRREIRGTSTHRKHTFHQLLSQEYRWTFLLLIFSNKHRSTAPFICSPLPLRQQRRFCPCTCEQYEIPTVRVSHKTKEGGPVGGVGFFFSSPPTREVAVLCSIHLATVEAARSSPLLLQSGYLRTSIICEENGVFAVHCSG